MATANAILNTRYKSKDGTYPIIILLLDGKKEKRHPLRFKIGERFWKNGQVVGHPDAEVINSVIDENLLKAKRYFADCRIKNIPIDLSLIFTSEKSHSFTGYLKTRADQHKKSDQIEMYFKAMRFKKELETVFGEVFFHQVNAEFVRTYDAFLIQSNAPNTRNKKMEFLAKYYGNAIKEGKATGINHFKEHKIPTTPTRKEKLTLKEVESLVKLDLVDGPLRFARDLFLFAYYCKGIRFETAITMKRENIQNGRLHFLTNKGKKPLTAQIHPKLKAIIDHYKNDTDFIFGKVIPEGKIERRGKLGSINFMVNRSLKTVGELAKIHFPLSFHISRHSLAQHLKINDESIHVIKDILGHSKTSTTEIYLKGLDDQAVDPALDRLYK